jgi:hypothetical protein
MNERVVNIKIFVVGEKNQWKFTAEELYDSLPFKGFKALKREIDILVRSLKSGFQKVRVRLADSNIDSNIAKDLSTEELSVIKQILIDYNNRL